jgi:hypothetical protein
MPEARAPVPNQRGTIITITAKRPILLKEQALAIQHRLRGGPNMPVELFDDKELLAVVEDGYLLSGIDKLYIKVIITKVNTSNRIDKDKLLLR